MSSWDKQIPVCTQFKWYYYIKYETSFMNHPVYFNNETFAMVFTHLLMDI